MTLRMGSPFSPIASTETAYLFVPRVSGMLKAVEPV
jgi:hypothetical protein